MVPVDCCPDPSKLLKEEDYSNFIEKNPSIKTKPTLAVIDEEQKLYLGEEGDL